MIRDREIKEAPINMQCTVLNEALKRNLIYYLLN
jgi:hypothetical protein